MAIKKQIGLKQNVLFNLIYQILVIILPLITTPYISRVLHADGVGRYAFSYSVISYFILFANLGFSVYGQREIAAKKQSLYDLSANFYGIFIARLITTFVSVLVFLIIYIEGFFGEYSQILLCLSIELIGVSFDVAFFFTGTENFRFVSLVNILGKVTGLLGIICFVKKENDVNIYAICLAISVVLPHLIELLFLKGKIIKVQWADIELKRHFSYALKLFIPTIAVTIYQMLDKTLIGIMAQNHNYENGCYEQSYKIMRMVYVVCSIPTGVLASRNAFDYSSGQLDQIKKHTEQSLRFVFFSSFPSMVGLCVLAPKVCSLFLGPGYELSISLLRIMLPMIFIAGQTYLLGSGVLVPCLQDKVYIIATSIGAFINMCLNCVLITRFNATGASIATVFSEFTILLIMLTYVVKKMKFLTFEGYFSLIRNYICCSLIMAIPVIILNVVIKNNVISIIISTIAGAALYVISLLVIKDSFVLDNFYEITGRVQRLFQNKK